MFFVQTFTHIKCNKIIIAFLCNKLHYFVLVCLYMKIVMTEGYGIRDINTLEPFNDTTSVLIASLTKAFLTTLLAKSLNKSNK